MSKKIKGKDVNLFVDSNVVAASTSCTFTLTANTADAASKTDPGDGMWDNPEFTHYIWQMGNESFVVNIQTLSALLRKVVEGDATVGVEFQVGDGLIARGTAIITQLVINAPNGEKATLSLSLEGSSELSTGTATNPVVKVIYQPVEGKTMMLAIGGSTDSWHTIAASTSHTLTVSVQTADAGTKDDLDGVIRKEVTGKSVTVSTENLVALNDQSDVTGQFLPDLLEKAAKGATLKMSFGYYPSSKGVASGSDEDWGAAGVALLSGDFLCSSIKVNGAVKEDATYRADFTGKGMPTVE